MSLKILHLSDIHFKAESIHDLDIDLRNEIEFDLKSIIKQTGPLDLIMVGGDIAFSASAEEYEIAYQWLKTVACIIQCKEENVLTIPGNHDVERSKICHVLKGQQALLKSLKDRAKLDSSIYEYLKDGNSCNTLLKTFANYENFAQRYGAIPERNSPFFWEKDFNCGSQKIRIRGVNSAIVSSGLDHEQNSKLVVGSHQSLLRKEEGVIYIFMCHHPPDWLNDGEDVEREVQARARIHLYGHKHNFSSVQVGNSLKLAAGAMHPSRNEQDWDPRYNILELDTEEKNSDHFLNVKIWKRKWDKETVKFVPDYTDGKEFEEYSLKLNDYELSPQTVDKNSKTTATAISSQELIEDIEIINVKMSNPLRKLNYLFSSLPYHKKLRIAFDMELIDDTDALLENDVQRTKVYFKRAQDRNMLARLWTEVIKDNPTESNSPNPF